MANDNSSPAGRAIRAFADTINVGVNSATGGLLNKGIGYLMGATPEQVAQADAERRASLGAAGNVAAGIGNVYGLSKLGAGVAAARAAPAALTRSLSPFSLALPSAGGVVAAAVPKSFGAAAKLAAGGLAFGAPVIGGLDSTVNTPGAPSGKPSMDGAAAVRAVLDPVSQALSQGRAAPATLTPYDKQLAALSTILGSSKMTLSDLQAVTGMLPKQNKPFSPKDVMVGQAAAQSQQMFQQQLNDAAKLADTDPEKGAAARDAAMAAEFQRRISILGSNPMNVAQAQLLVPDQEN